MLVVSLINFGVKNQAPQVSFKIVFGDLISFHTLEYDMELFGSNMILFGFYIILFGSIFKFQEPSVMLVASLINFGVTNQVPKVSFKLVVGDLMLVSSYEFADILFTLNIPRASLPLVTCSSPHRTSKKEYFSVSSWTLAPNTWGCFYHSWFVVHG